MAARQAPQTAASHTLTNRNVRISFVLIEWRERNVTHCRHKVTPHRLWEGFGNSATPHEAPRRNT